MLIAKPTVKVRWVLLNYRDEQGNMMTADKPTAKAEALSAFFSSVFSHESTNNFEPLAQRKCSQMK